MTGEINNVIMNAKTMKDRASMMTFFFQVRSYKSNFLPWVCSHSFGTSSEFSCLKAEIKCCNLLLVSVLFGQIELTGGNKEF